MDDFTSKIDKASFVAKQNALWRKEYMFLYDVIEDEKEIAREIGLSEGGLRVELKVELKVRDKKQSKQQRILSGIMLI